MAVTETPAESLRAAPGRNILRLLGETKLIDFAVAVAPAKERGKALSAIRKYTHPVPSERPTWPSPSTVAKWAQELGVHWSEFYART